MRSTTRRSWAGVAALLLALSAGCTAAPEPTAGTTPTTSTTTPNRSAPLPPASLAVVDAGIVTGLTSDVSESLEHGQYWYLSLPTIPGADAWRDAIEAQVAPKIQRFRELSPKDTNPPYPELSFHWDLIAASPQALGVRLITTELGQDDTFQGDVETSWWDPVNRQAYGPSALVTEDASPEFFARLAAAAAANPALDPARVSEQLDGEWEGIQSVGFTTTGELWVEFSRRQVSDADVPVGVAVDPTGLLSAFGHAAQRAATNPTDPAATSPAPSQTVPTVSATASAPSRVPATTTPSATAPSARPPNCAKLTCVALTFDDGPVTGTSELLDVLKAKGVRATFFVVGYNIAAHRNVLRRMVAEGHVVGNHTFAHQQLTRLSAAAVRSEITKTNTVIEKTTDVTPIVLRPPYGATNATVRRVAGELGLSQILWNVDPLDWKDRDSAMVTKRVLAAARPGSIILSHDIHPTTRKAYARIIDGLRAKGFTLVTVPELLGSRLKAGESFRSR